MAAWIRPATVVSHVVSRVPHELRGRGRLSFDVPVVRAARYRVRVFPYDRVENAGVSG
jgi:hypothetical protein